MDLKEAAMFAYVGGHTRYDRDGRGDGIDVYRVDSSSGTSTHVQHVTGEENHPCSRCIPTTACYIRCMVGSPMSVNCIDRTSGYLRLLNRQRGGGTIRSMRRWTRPPLSGCAEFSSGNVAVPPLAEDGALQPVSEVFDLPASQVQIRRSRVRRIRTQ